MFQELHRRLEGEVNQSIDDFGSDSPQLLKANER